MPANVPAAVARSPDNPAAKATALAPRDIAAHPQIRRSAPVTGPPLAIPSACTSEAHQPRARAADRTASSVKPSLAAVHGDPAGLAYTDVPYWSTADAIAQSSGPGGARKNPGTSQWLVTGRGPRGLAAE